MVRQRMLLTLAAVLATGMIIAAPVASQEGQPEDRPARRPGARGQRDPDQRREARERFRQRSAQRMQESLEASDEEWKILSPRLEKVQTLLRDSRGGAMRGRMMGRFGRRGGMAAREGLPAREQTDVQRKGEAVRTLLEDSEAKPAEINSALAGLRKAREKSRQELAAARKELRDVVTLRQEARLVLMGLLD